jgi:hypothetical protein
MWDGKTSFLATQAAPRCTAWGGARIVKNGCGYQQFRLREIADGNTCYLERWNCTLHQRLGCSVLSTLSFSQSERMHEPAPASVHPESKSVI